MQPKYRSSAFERVSKEKIAYFSHKKFLFSKFMFAAKFVYWISGFDLMSEKKKVVALLSGGLDSQLAVKMMQKQGFDVHAVALRTPFCDFDCGKGCGFDIVNRAEALNVPLKTVFLGEEYIEMLKHPKYGRGA